MSWTSPTLRATGDLITSAIWNAEIVADMNEVWREVDYAQITTATTNVTATTAATANTLITGTSQAYAAALLLIEFRAESFDIGTSNISINVWEDANDLGTIAFTTAVGRVPASGVLRRTPSAATHQYSIRAWVNGGTGHVYGGAGGAGASTPAFLRVWQKGA